MGESGRGSSQFGGDADKLLHLKRPEGHTRKAVRVLEAVGRFEETPEAINIELDLDRGEYRSLGDSGAFVEREAMAIVADILATTPAKAWETSKVVDKAGERVSKRSTVINALNKLAEDRTIRKLGKGKKNDPYRYFKLPPERNAGQGENSFKTPSPKDRTNENGRGLLYNEHRKPGCTPCLNDLKKIVRQGMKPETAEEEVYLPIRAE